MHAANDTERAERIDMIRDSAAAITGAGGPQGRDLGRTRALRFQDPGFDRAVWRDMAALGWIGLRVPEERGGAGLGMGEFCALLEALGAALVPEPLIGASLAATLLAADAHDTEALPALLSGERLSLVAWQERADTLHAPGSPDAPRLFIPMAAGADAWLIPVREGGRLALRHADGRAVIEPTQDGGHYGTLSPPWDTRAGLDDIGGVLEAALDDAALATAAYLLGCMEAAFAITLDFLRTRKQFGRPIGSFQSLQHRAADLRMQIALTRASIELAAAILDAGATGAARQAAVSRAKARAADAALLVTRQAIQLHGGIGYTDEYDVGLYLRKAMVLANQYGSARLHRRRFVAAAPESDE